MTECLVIPISIDLAAADVSPLVQCGTRILCGLRPGSASDRQTADFIRRRFEQAYGARPVLQMPPLVALASAQGTLLAAVGVRDAGQARLFLEDYLDQPLEALLRGVPSGRETVVEIAHLAGVESGISRPLFAALAVWLQAGGKTWVVCTGTAQLRNSFRHMGIGVMDLGAADPCRLPDGGRCWGRYYECQPRVLAMNVAEGVASLQSGGLLRQVRAMGPATVVERGPTVGGRYGCIA